MMPALEPLQTSPLQPVYVVPCGYRMSSFWNALESFKPWKALMLLLGGRRRKKLGP